jgi:hypothetical protein
MMNAIPDRRPMLRTIASLITGGATAWDAARKT